jgi:hypothetical protein
MCVCVGVWVCMRVRVYASEPVRGYIVSQLTVVCAICVFYSYLLLRVEGMNPRGDPFLGPAFAPADLLKHFPPTIIGTCERVCRRIFFQFCFLVLFCIVCV